MEAIRRRPNPSRRERQDIYCLLCQSFSAVAFEHDSELVRMDRALGHASPWSGRLAGALKPPAGHLHSVQLKASAELGFKLESPKTPNGALERLYLFLQLFSILAIVTGANSYRGIRTFIKVQLKRLNKAFKIGWKRPPAHTAIRYLAFDGKALKGSVDAFNDAKARQILSAFAVDTALVLAHIVIYEKSNEIPAVQKLLEELDVAGHRPIKRQPTDFVP